MIPKLFLLALVTIYVALTALPAQAWGQAGHALIGKAAVAQASPAARAAVLEILGIDSGIDAGGDPNAALDTALDAALEEACNWPDTLRASGTEPSTAPLHYVNLPRSDPHYDRQRDCPDGLCVTEGILRFAAELSRLEGDPSEPARARRWQAFAWLCHLVGDLHQPLHAAFRDDRGANRVEVTYRGEQYNLHQFWDDVLEKERMTVKPLGAAELAEPDCGSTKPWEPADVVAWTDESHALALTASYPPGPEIDDAFADRSWALVQKQWKKAARRLASILDAVLAEPAGPAGP
jgi:hypothetical protein